MSDYQLQEVNAQHKLFYLMVRDERCGAGVGRQGSFPNADSKPRLLTADN